MKTTKIRCEATITLQMREEDGFFFNPLVQGSFKRSMSRFSNPPTWRCDLLKENAFKGQRIWTIRKWKEHFCARDKEPVHRQGRGALFQVCYEEVYVLPQWEAVSLSGSQICLGGEATSPSSHVAPKTGVNVGRQIGPRYRAGPWLLCLNSSN